MPEIKSTLQSKVIGLASEALTSFCDDMSGMFGVEMSCEQVDVSKDPGEDINKHFKKLGAVYSVNVTGALNNDLRILVDRAGLFTITGVVVMLPQSRILSSAKRGTLADATEISDAVGEVGNLMVGSWDRIFREGFQDNTHLLHTGTFVGDPNAEDNGVIDLASDGDVTFVSYEMSVGEYPSFQCGVYLPSRLFDESTTNSESDAQDVVVPEAEEAVTTEPVAETAPVPKPEKIPVQTEEAPVEAVPAREVDPAPETAQVPEPKAAPVEADEAQVEAAPTEAAEPAAETGQKPVSQEAPVQTDEAHVEAVTVEKSDPVFVPAQSVSGNAEANLLAKHLMQTQVHWVSVDDTVNQAQTKMQEAGVPYLLVGDGTKLEGIVTHSDLGSAASIYLRPIFSKWRRPEDDATLQIRLKWIMSKQVYSVNPETPLCNIVHLKCKYDISCLPVVDVQGQILGVVTTKDMLKSVVNRGLEEMGVAVA